MQYDEETWNPTNESKPSWKDFIIFTGPSQYMRIQSDFNPPEMSDMDVEL